jgi:hypothetical protein
MRQALFAMLTIGAVSTFAMPSGPAQAQSTLICDAFNRCIPATQQSYDACYQLAMRRGWNMQPTDYKGRTAFIYDCLRGRIPR